MNKDMTFDAMVNANIHRFKEGARVLEDVARFNLQDKELFLAIKDLKHKVVITEPLITKDKDIGGEELIEERKRQSLLDLVNANASRMQEAIRVLEEITGEHHYKQIRFASYELHARLFYQLRKYLKQQALQGIYAICDPEKYNVKKMAQIINEKKISICQIRMKTLDKHAIVAAFKKMGALLNREQTLLIVNDHLDIAMAYADGVHLGQSDLPIEVARKLARENFILGASCHNVIEAQQAIHAGANYIAVGCLYSSQTKKDAISVSENTLAEIVQLSNVPVCAIGGIQENHIAKLKELGVKMMAMQGALWT